jgi:CPA2 family monovalent cation:H+ antiporter-2
MLFEPSVLVEEPLHVVLVVAVIVAAKSFAAFTIVVGTGYGLRTALVVAAALSQIGEFSFILIGLATSLDVVPDEATNLILAGALISITLNPFIFRNVDESESILSRFSGVVNFAQRRYPEVEVELDLRRHAVIVGYGRTGAGLARSLAGRNLPFVIVDYDPFVYDRAVAAGHTCVFGDATNAEVLQQADIEQARVFAVTFSNPSDTLLAAQAAHNLNPTLNVITRTTGSGTANVLRATGVSEVVDPEFEAGLEFVRHVLHRFGVDGREIGALQTRWRAEYYRAAE